MISGHPCHSGNPNVMDHNGCSKPYECVGDHPPLWEPYHALTMAQMALFRNCESSRDSPPTLMAMKPCKRLAKKMINN